MSKVNRKKLLIGVGLLTAGILFIGIGVAIGGSVGGAVVIGASLLA